MSQNFVIEVVIPEVPADKDVINLTGDLKWLIESSNAGREILPKGTIVRHLCALEPGESWEVVVPAAAEEVERQEVAGNFVTLRLLSLIHAKAEIRHLLGPLAENISEISNVVLRGNCLKANILFFSCPAPTPFVFELLPETVGRILG